MGEIARWSPQGIHRGGDIAGKFLDPREPLHGLVRRENAIAQRCEIARAAASDGQPCQRARHVRRGAQDTAKIVAQGAVVRERRDGIEAMVDGRTFGQRCCDPLCQQA